MDFVASAWSDGWRLRALTVVDARTCDALPIGVDQGIKGEQVVAAVARASAIRGTPKTIRVDYAPEFISKALAWWAEQPKVPAMRSIIGMAAEGCENGVTLDFSQPGKPTDKVLDESCKRGASRRMPEQSLILSRADARAKFET